MTPAHAPHQAFIDMPARRRTLPAGYLVATPNHTENQVFMVESGRLRVSLSGQSRALTLSYLEPGDIYTTHTPTYIETVSPTVLRMVETAQFAQQLRTDPAAIGTVMRVLGRLLENSVALVEDLAFRDVPARLARFLLGLAERRGTAVAGGVLVPLELNMEDVASLLGTTRQTASSLMNQFERDGWLQRPTRRSVLVTNMARLEALAGRDGSVG